jgi:hypothetical protein
MKSEKDFNCCLDCGLQSTCPSKIVLDHLWLVTQSNFRRQAETSDVLQELSLSLRLESCSLKLSPGTAEQTGGGSGE